MKTIFAITAAAGLALTSMPAMADSHMDSSDIMLNAQQKSMMASWPADRQQTYMAWPQEAQAYYWTLSAEQKEGWWMLDNPQRVRIVGMNPADRAAVWRNIASQMSTASAPARTMPTAMNSTNVRYVSNSMVQDIPPPLNGEYPPCTNSRMDNCMNPSAM